MVDRATFRRKFAHQKDAKTCILCFVRRGHATTNEKFSANGSSHILQLEPLTSTEGKSSRQVGIRASMIREAKLLEMFALQGTFALSFCEEKSRRLSCRKYIITNSIQFVYSYDLPYCE